MKHYVYTLARPDGRVFYVGKGVRGRIHKHEWAAKNGEQSHKANIIRKIWAEGGQVVKQKVFESDNEQEALAEEVRLIAYYGRENLANLTDGGDVNSGWKPRLETIIRRVASLTGKKRTSEQRLKISEAHKGIVYGPPSDEKRKKISEAQKGKPKPKHSEEERLRKSERQKGRKRPPVSEETRRKLSESHKGQRPSKETLVKRSESLMGKKRSSETIQKMREAQQKRREMEKHGLS